MSEPVPELAIICVDDERIVLTSLREQLRRNVAGDILLETAESGEEGLEVFDELTAEGVQVALVVSDQLMPGMRGEALLAAIHERDERVLNVLLTGQATADAVGAAVNNARLYRYIGKPWDEQDLVLTVREALRSYRLAREIEARERAERLAHAASLRFVPRELLALLGRERLVDVRFGDHVEREMGLLFSDLRGFTTLVEGKSPAEAFAFVNTYIQRMDAQIRAYGGVIGNIEGDAILALFPDDCDGAVAAGIAAHRTIMETNVARRAAGEPPIRLGLSVNFGRVLLGTVGSEERLQCDVVGDPVNVAARLEGLTKLYGARMLISGETLDRLRTPPTVRYLDRVRAKGKQHPVTLYEVLDAQPPEIAARREATRADYRAGIAAYGGGELEEAEGHFRAVLRTDPDDKAAQVFLRRIARLVNDDLPAGWSGVTHLHHK